MRTLAPLALALIGATSVRAQSLAWPIQVPAGTGTYLDDRSTCPNADSIYFSDIGMYNDGRAVTYTATNPNRGPRPWSFHVLPHPNGYTPGFFVAACKVRSGYVLSQCMDLMTSPVTTSNGLVGVEVPAMAGTFYVVVTHAEYGPYGACGAYTLTGVRH